MIYRPPYSPELNPIENVGAFIKEKLGSKLFKNYLNSKIIAIWEEISVDQINKNYISIYNRIWEWIDNNGKLTSY